MNKTAEVELHGCFPKTRDKRVAMDAAIVARYGERLRKVNAELGADFCGYEAETGTWRFVQHEW